MVNHHFLLVTYPGQGHINPTLQFAKRLIRLGARVTFATTVYSHRRMTTSHTPDGLSFAPFSDGYDDGIELKTDEEINDYINELQRRGSEALTQLVASSANQGHPVTYLIYNFLFSWVSDVARELHLPSVVLWLQPAMVFEIYYHFFNGYGDVIRNNRDPSRLIDLPGLPSLTSRDLPSFIDFTKPNTVVPPAIQELFESLEKESNPTILANTFDELEPEVLREIEKYNFIGIGPLIPSAFLDGNDPSDTSFGGDIFQGSKDAYIEWLNSKPESTVIYVSFGSMAVLKKQQLEEIARGLLDSGHPFLWVIRGKQNGEEEKEEDKLSCREELEEKGMIVPWCSQVEVLSHPSLGCFLTHCGWNSTSESLVSGVPMVGFPQWSDQGTNAKLIEDVWKTGVRVHANKEGIAEGDEIKRCLDLVMENEDMRRNAKKFKDLARVAAKEGGSSDKNLKAFVEGLQLH